jgi:hypothetical protein
VSRAFGPLGLTKARAPIRARGAKEKQFPARRVIEAQFKASDLAGSHLHFTEKLLK